VAGNFGYSSEEESFAAINVTPLVDVVLVLLVIFLITAPSLYQSTIKVHLPQAKTAETSEKSPLHFTIDKEGELTWDKNKIEWTGLTKHLAALLTTIKNVDQQTAIISADEMTPHGKVIQLIDSLRQTGLTHFALNVDSPPKN
jgi:biopolymer transport protein TolR